MLIVVALAQSPDAWLALDVALGLGPQHEFRLLHVDEINEPSAFDPFHDKIDRVVNKQIHEAGDELAEHIRARMASARIGDDGAPEYDWQLVRREGDARKEICEYARSVNADLIVVGTRDVGKLSSILLGSVSSYATQHAPCSVLVARKQGEE